MYRLAADSGPNSQSSDPHTRHLSGGFSPDARSKVPSQTTHHARRMTHIRIGTSALFRRLRPIEHLRIAHIQWRRHRTATRQLREQGALKPVRTPERTTERMPLQMSLQNMHVEPDGQLQRFLRAGHSRTTTITITTAKRPRATVANSGSGCVNISPPLVRRAVGFQIHDEELRAPLLQRLAAVCLGELLARLHEELRDRHHHAEVAVILLADR